MTIRCDGAVPAQPAWKEYAALLTFIAVLSMLMFAITSGDKASKRDFICYWAAGRLLAAHQNPYDDSSVLAIEKSAGYAETRALVMRPLALGSALWIFLVLGCIAVSIHLLRELHGSPANRIHLLGYAFAPALACLLAGQSAALMLAAMVLFLWLHHERPFLAGLALSGCAIKPHLLLPFGVAFLLWTVDRKQLRLLLGAGTGLLASFLVAAWFRPAIASDYFHMMTDSGLDQEFMPTPSMVLRLIIHPAWTWLQMVPAFLACLWAVWYYVRHSKEWSWNRSQGSLLLLVSVWVAPRAWLTDEVIVLPALLTLAYNWRQHRIAAALLAAAATTALGEVLCGVPLTSGFYLWTSSAWLACYLAFASAAVTCE